MAAAKQTLIITSFYSFKLKDFASLIGFNYIEHQDIILLMIQEQLYGQD